MEQIPVMKRVESDYYELRRVQREYGVDIDDTMRFDSQQDAIDTLKHMHDNKRFGVYHVEVYRYVDTEDRIIKEEKLAHIVYPITMLPV